jgi:SAM-dependent methyltransferase
MRPERNIDARTVAGFGEEWSRFDQSQAPEADLKTDFADYFDLLPRQFLQPDRTGIDLGCGSGRWAKKVAPLVGRVICVDASSQALAVARNNLASFGNVEFLEASVSEVPLPAESADFVFSLGVLNHVPDTRDAMRECARLLKPEGPLLVYLYYNFENRPAWFRAIWRVSDAGRRMISRMPFGVRRIVSDIIAGLVYWPLARGARLAEALGMSVDGWPISYYRAKSFYKMRTDALDRFGTALERRFSRAQIREMLQLAGFERVQFSDKPPYWCAIGFKAPAGPSSRPTK